MGKCCDIERVRQMILTCVRPEEVVEFMVHPGYSSASSGYGDEFSRSDERETELRNLCDPTWESWLADNDVEISGFDRLSRNAFTLASDRRAYAEA
mmetsp:Transcript_33210/g.93094  ORF Transcript_33210/g.93094 Transcript_33210/m.93094 type:complete len:96 (+) Transcript_33210:2492-2779(+)